MLLDIADLGIPCAIDMPFLRKSRRYIDYHFGSAHFGILNANISGFHLRNQLAMLADPQTVILPECLAPHLAAFQAKRLRHHFKHISSDFILYALENSGRAVSAEDRELLSRAASECLHRAWAERHGILAHHIRARMSSIIALLWMLLRRIR